MADAGQPEVWEGIICQRLVEPYSHIDAKGNTFASIEGAELRTWDRNEGVSTALRLSGPGPLRLLSIAENAGAYLSADGHVWIVDRVDGTCSALSFAPVDDAWAQFVSGELSIFASSRQTPSDEQLVLTLARLQGTDVSWEAHCRQHELVLRAAWDTEGDSVAWTALDWSGPEQPTAESIWRWKLGDTGPEEFLQASPDEPDWYVGWTPRGDLLYQVSWLVEHELHSVLRREGVDVALLSVFGGLVADVRFSRSAPYCALALSDEHWVNRVVIIDCAKSRLVALSPIHAAYELLGWTLDGNLAVIEWLDPEDLAQPQIQLIDLSKR